jgi:outer membrane receptor for ferrienterochelin and colicins
MTYFLGRQFRCAVATVAALLPLAGAVRAQAPAVPRPVSAVIAGRVLSGGGAPIASATVGILGAPALVRTDSLGRFTLASRATGEVTVRIRAIGHAPAQRVIALRAGVTDTLNVVLAASASMLNTIVTTATMQERFVSDAPVKVDVVTPAFLQRNAGNNVMDNVSFLPGLSQQVDCGVCFTNNIRINGMEGPYTAVLIDGTPMMSALATVYGLNSIDPSQIEQIEITKGPNSTLYGAEAMGGVINIVTKDARLAPKSSLNVFATSNGEMSVAMAAAPQIGSARTLLSINGAWNQRFVDKNADGFSDLPLVKRISVLNKWAIGSPAARRFEVMGRYYAEDRFGGVRAWSVADRGSSTVYGESIRTNRAELLGTYRLGNPMSPIRVDFSANWHKQNSAYGDQPYLATQTTAFAQGIWSPQRGAHAFVIGGTLRRQSYADSTLAQRTREMRFIPGVFVQDEIALGSIVTVLAGLRVDHHRAHGVIPSPRLALKWDVTPHTTFRTSAATGFRVVSLFSEDHAALTGARQVVIAEQLKPERSATATAGINSVFDIGGVEDAMTLDVDAFYTRFTNRITGDFNVDPNAIVYRNLNGHAVTQGVSLALGYATLRKPLFGNVGTTLQDVFLVDGGSRRALPFAASVQTVFTAGYRFADIGLTIDWTGRVQGPAALPQFAGLASRSTWLTEQHLQVTQRLSTGRELYAAVKNIFDYVQRDAIIDPFNPFGDRFDTARVYGPLQGRRLLVGFRQTVAR